MSPEELEKLRRANEAGHDLSIHGVRKLLAEIDRLQVEVWNLQQWKRLQFATENDGDVTQ